MRSIEEKAQLRRSITKKSIAHKLKVFYIPLVQLKVKRIDHRVSHAFLQTHRLTCNTNYDGFLYQCRVSPKISTRVVSNRNGKSNGFHFVDTESLPGNETVVDLSNQPRVPVLSARTSFEEAKPVLSLYAGYQLGMDFEQGEGSPQLAPGSVNNVTSKPKAWDDTAIRATTAQEAVEHK